MQTQDSKIIYIILMKENLEYLFKFITHRGYQLCLKHKLETLGLRFEHKQL